MEATSILVSGLTSRKKKPSLSSALQLENPSFLFPKPFASDLLALPKPNSFDTLALILGFFLSSCPLLENFLSDLGLDTTSLTFATGLAPPLVEGEPDLP